MSHCLQQNTSSSSSLQGITITNTTKPCSLTNPEIELNLEQINAVYRQLKKELDEQEHVRFQYFLSSHCDVILHKAKKRKRSNHSDSVHDSKPHHAPPFAGTIPVKSVNDVHTTVQNQTLRCEESTGTFTVKFRRIGQNKDSANIRSESVSPIVISSLSGGSDELPLPSHSFCLPITQPYKIEDQPELTFVPILEKQGDEPLSRRTILSMHKTTYREDLVRYGAECQQEQTKKLIDALFQRLFCSDEDGQARIPPLKHSIWEMISKVTMEPLSRIQRRVMDWVSACVPNIEIAQSDDVDMHDPNTSAKRNKLDMQYEKATDDFRKLWCRQCYIYDCNIHGLSYKPTVCVQTMLAKAKEKDGCWQKYKRSDKIFQQSCDVSGDDHSTEIVGSRTSLVKQLYSIFEGNSEHISCLLRAPIRAVEKHISLQEPCQLLDVLPPMNLPPRKKSISKYYSAKNYRYEWYSQYRDSKIFPYFYPCLHDGPCRDALNCSCIDNRFFCTLACAWNKFSPNFFRGCACSAHCGQQCTCFLAKRECDPDLCACSTCTDPANQLITTQRCRNDNHRMNRNAELLIGRSSVAGWGLFTRNALNVGDYVGKYIGELMSQDEADRRGLIADARDCTYLFLLSSDLSIDASQKGNNLRFINHSDTPNVEPRTMFVQGQQEIGFYAITSIPEQTELFFDYNFKSVCDDNIMDLSQSKIPWMKGNKSRDANKTKGTSRIKNLKKK